MDRYRPGPGWRHIAGSVYEKGSVRIHMWGLVRTPSGQLIQAKTIKYFGEIARFVRINGGSWKRGFMAWANRFEVERRKKSD